MKILLADDHAMLRAGLKLMLLEAFKQVEFGEAENCQQTLDRALHGSWDLVILDVAMPGRGGLDVLKEIHSHRQDLPVLVLSTYEERQFAMRAFRCGARGYLTKSSAGTELIRAVDRILAGGRYVSAMLAEQMASVLGGATGPLHERLSDREFEILRLFAAGKTVKDIAAEVSLSVNTISTYRARIMEKMNMHNNAELMHYAISNKLVE